MIDLRLGDCRTVLRDIPNASIDAVVTDPPYDLISTSRGTTGFMDMSWDATGVAFLAATWQEVLRVCKPGAHLLAFGGTRTQHRMVCAIEEAGFEIVDSMVWIYSSGFAKGKGLPDGLGAALKPAHEDICVARVPRTGTILENLAAHGTGALRIDDNRIGTTKRVPSSTSTRQGYSFADGRTHQSLDTPGMDPNTGRWPANVAFSHSLSCTPIACTWDCPVAELDRQSGPGQDSRTPAHRRISHFGKNSGPQDVDTRMVYEGGGASRFFYVTKASDRERTANHSITNNHPTVKPVTLLRHLVRLVCPADGVVLDPFMGSGSTGVAALEESCSFIGIEQDPAYLATARLRLDSVHPTLFPPR